MFTPRNRVEQPPLAVSTANAGFFGWRGGGIVLLGETDGERWIVVRGWLSQDTLTDVRRWTFTGSDAFAGQVRRLAMEATGDDREAVAAGSAATSWAASFV